MGGGGRMAPSQQDDVFIFFHALNKTTVELLYDHQSQKVALARSP